MIVSSVVYFRTSVYCHSIFSLLGDNTEWTPKHYLNFKSLEIVGAELNNIKEVTPFH